ncbi:MAG: GMC family oxidoreductase, partial [Bacteroidia bacterium]|nr:GMC family oxidoreductase [Bacteroidia bacterium]
SALRLSEKGYKVLVIEKGKWWKPSDFPENNWQLKKWLWEPKFGLKGFFKMTFLNHVTVLSGVGVGGGSLTYANTLPIPKSAFFKSGTWKDLADWETELKPHYQEAYRMLGAEVNPSAGPADKAMKRLAQEIGREDHFEPTKVAVYFGKPGVTVPDPYFGGKGPDRTGCALCGECMTGCRHNAKNTLDKNYLYLAQQLGAEIRAEHEVTDVLPRGAVDGNEGYTVYFKNGRQKGTVTTKGIVFAGGVLGTVPLLLKLKKRSLPNLSDKVGCRVSTNNEALINVMTKDDDIDNTKGIAIGSILHTDENSHLEPVRYGQGSGFFKTMMLPMAHGSNFIVRLFKMIWEIIKAPLVVSRMMFTKKYSEKSNILLFMQTLNSTIRIKRGMLTPMKTVVESGPKPSAFIPEAKDLVEKHSKIVNGTPFVSYLETLFGIPTTAHILGGAGMGATKEEGVINANNEVHGYKNMLVCDGSMISANPGVNPSLSITAISELAMSKIPAKYVINPGNHSTIDS